MVTKPTVGRKLWFFASAQHALENAAGLAEAQPFDATVIFVHDERTVNLLVVNPYGESGPVLGAMLRQEGDPPINGPHATWMPYQVKQAEKHAETAVPPGEILQKAAPHETATGAAATANTSENSIDSPGDKL